MRKFFALLVLLLATYWSFQSAMPRYQSGPDVPVDQFSTDRALAHVKTISEKPHYVGSEAHAEVRAYIIQTLEGLGLEVETQKGYTFDSWGGLAKPINILARVKGSASGKALMLLSHYDSAPHSKSHGASDAGSGVATILEGLRAFLAEGKQPLNDIIVLISDSEEIGLNGAELFCRQHAWTKDVGLVLNFEARGSGGASYMLIETNGGNKQLVKAFKEAKPSHPVSNSLAYSIYKMLPNDTDLTVFREERDIDGFNFAFIDDHYDYHTANDTYERLDRNTLAHQGTYLMSLLPYFANRGLEDLKVEEGTDHVYFNTAVGFFDYPFSWVLPMFILAVLIFFFMIFYGIKEGKMNTKDIFWGFIPFLISLVASGLIAHFGWQLILKVYPGYGDMLHGFTYNGHAYIAFVVALTLAICFWAYHKFKSVDRVASFMVAPIFFWLLLNGAFAFYLKGAGFFIIPVFIGLLLWFIRIRQKDPSYFIIAILAAPILLMLAPFVKMFPVGLGLKILAVSAVMVVLLFGLLLPILGGIRRKGFAVFICSFFALAYGIRAHMTSSFNEERPKPNSLVFMQAPDDGKAYWLSYDRVLDEWTQQFLGENPSSAESMTTNVAYSKYGSRYRHVTPAPMKDIAVPKIDITLDTIIGSKRKLQVCIAPQRFVNRLEVFAPEEVHFYAMSINGVKAKKQEGEDFVMTKRWRNKLFGYYFTDQEPIELTMEVPVDQRTELQLMEASFDLLENEAFGVPERPAKMMPKPFVLNDAIIQVKNIVIQ